MSRIIDIDVGKKEELCMICMNWVSVMTDHTENVPVS